jgi:hypothetical protein
MSADTPWCDRKEELQRLREAIRKRESLLIWGAPGAGKTALVQQALRQASEGADPTCVYLSGMRGLRELLERLTLALAEQHEHLPADARGLGAASARARARWLAGQTSRQLRSVILSALAQGDYRLFLDHVPPMSHATARFVKEITWRSETPAFLTARSHFQKDIGHAWSLYWTDRYRLKVGPLPVAAARKLFAYATRKYGLSPSQSKSVEADLLRPSERLPGRILKMCELAAQPQYQEGGAVKTGLVYVDYLMQTDAAAGPR